MKIKAITHTLLTLLVILSACNRDFNLGDIGSAGKLVLYCMPCADRDTTLIQLSRSQPVTGKGKTIGSLSNAQVIFSVNGQEQPVHYAKTSLPSVPAGCYYVLGRWKEADLIRVRAEADGLPAISAETTIPTAFPLQQMDLVLKKDIDKMLQFRITFRDSAKTEDYYGVRIVRRATYRNVIDNRVISTEDDILELETDNEPLLNDKTGLDATFDLSGNFYQYLYIWNDEKIQGKSYTLRPETYYRMNNTSMWDGSNYSYTYKAYLYKLSPEMYRYLKSMNDIKNNDLGQTGLSPMRSSYTNVDGGIGVLGGCQIAETEWMENPSEKEPELPLMKWNSDDVTIGTIKNSSTLKVVIPRDGGTFKIRNLSENYLLFYWFDGTVGVLTEEVQNEWFHAAVKEDQLQITVQPNDTGEDRTVSVGIMSGNQKYQNVYFLFEQSGME